MYIDSIVNEVCQASFGMLHILDPSFYTSKVNILFTIYLFFLFFNGLGPRIFEYITFHVLAM